MTRARASARAAPAPSPVAAFAALADETRWTVLEALADDEAVGSGGLTASALAERLPVTRQAIAKHLALLEGAGLVESGMVGRERRFRALGAELTALGRRLERIGDAWEARLGRIATIAEDLERG
ncbi:ArsR/SmtB family transcription factor [Promicromonospora panici]|uniref:ArsR/SmtB family transcription factor n=1 Tax=Promicromonospora panici TaxID=2219658 RepID=UPI00101D023B|nr:helix-turn-helix domain-containing protein [Promicromonospora panici]